MFKIELKVQYRDADNNIKESPILRFFLPFKWVGFKCDCIETYDEFSQTWVEYQKGNIVYLKIERCDG